MVAGSGACVGLAATAAAVAGWAGPALLRARVLRTAVWPELAGMGRPDHIALTFDDGPDPEATPAVLEALHRLGWTASFFMLGGQVVRYPDVAAAVVAAGHEAAVHGFSHRNHLVRGPAELCRDVARAATAVTAATGVQPSWFRPPYGVLTLGSLNAARRVGLQPVLWSAWGRDWEARTPAEVTGTVLLHDSDCTARMRGSWRTTVQALSQLARIADQLGCTVGPLRDHSVSSFRPAGRPIRERNAGSSRRAG